MSKPKKRKRRRPTQTTPIPSPAEIARMAAEIRAANKAKAVRNREPAVIPVEIPVVPTWQQPTPRHRSYLPDYQL
jgi:hypothetical protein